MVPIVAVAIYLIYDHFSATILHTSYYYAKHTLGPICGLLYYSRTKGSAEVPSPLSFLGKKSVTESKYDSETARFFFDAVK